MRSYTLALENGTIVGSPTLAAFNPVAGTVIQVTRAWANQAANATSAQQRVRLATQVSAFPTLVSQAPAKINTGDPASGIVGGTAGAAGTSGVNASAEGAGGKTVIIPDAFNVLNGYLWVPTPPEIHFVRAADSVLYAISFPATPGTLTNWNAGLVIGEL